nr:ATPase WRNIP1 [Tanacetum cinerariifolium]
MAQLGSQSKGKDSILPSPGYGVLDPVSVVFGECRHIQNRRDLPKDTPIDRLEVLSDDGNPSRANIKQALGREKPLSERVRPHTINDIIGQDHLLSDKPYFHRSAIEANHLPSFILWVPPGTGKTSIGRAIVNSCSLSSSYRFVSLSAVTVGVKDVRDVVDEAKRIKKTSVNNMRTVLFVDEEDEMREKKKEEVGNGKKEQLLAMAFSDELIAQALSATGGNSLSNATEWILSHEKNKPSSISFPPNNNTLSSLISPISVSSPTTQPKINRFFYFDNKKTKSPDNPKQPQPLKPQQQPQPQEQQQQSISSKTRKHPSRREKPLSERVRPHTINDIIGQDHLLSDKPSFHRSAIEANHLPSFILWVPPGTGKTSIGRAIVNSCSLSSSYRFVSLSAVTVGVKDVRDVVDEAKRIKKTSVNNMRTMLFVDEVHRFNKSEMILFCRVLKLNLLEPVHIVAILRRASVDRDNGLVCSLCEIVTHGFTLIVISALRHSGNENNKKTKRGKKKREMEKEKEQLLAMGFSDELIAQALSATGGNSLSDATEWILSHENNNKPSSISFPPNNNTSSSPITSPTTQPKINRFFSFDNKKTKSPDNPKQPQPLKPQQQPQPQEQQQQQQSISSKKRKQPSRSEKPLSERMRPHTINDIIGQDHLLSDKSSFLRSAIEANRLPSFILWGPPGTGKTSIGRAIVNSCSLSSSYRFVSLSAVTSGVKDVRDVVDEARRIKKTSINSMRTVLFVDEVHRFNKSQLDSFLPVIEDGSIVFIGATTENPSFHLITPLLSRCRVLTLNLLEPVHIVAILRRATDDRDNGLVCSLGFMPKEIQVCDEVVEYLSQHCDGDARVALNALEISAITAAARLGYNGNVSDLNRSVDAIISVIVDDAKQALQSKHLSYDKDGEQHYNLISALHKSMRGSDANASIYWLARMLEGGEQPLYIARRLIQFSSEDVGMADPLALPQAVSCYQACHFLGMPECSVNLAQCVVYLALAPKSIAVYRALQAATKAVKDSVGQNEGVPLHLRNAPTKLMKELGYAKGYIYTPDNPSAVQSFLPPSLQGSKFLDWPAADI